MAGMADFGDALDGPCGRELLIPSKQERSAMWTNRTCHAVRLFFLLSHGALVVSVSLSLDEWKEAEPYKLFAPAWVGDAVCGVLLIYSWFASCPYIKLCLSERQPRVRDGPSILTEILPEIVLAILGMLFLLLIFFSEFALCGYLKSEQAHPIGEAHGLAAACILLVIVGLIAACHGACLTHNSSLYLFVGTSVLSSTLLFAVTRSGNSFSQALTVIPAVIGVTGLLVFSMLRFRAASRILTQQERSLRIIEVVALCVLLGSTVFLAYEVAEGLGRPASPASMYGVIAGCTMCVLAVLRAVMFYLEAQKGLIEERIFAALNASPGAEVPMVQRSAPPTPEVSRPAM